MSDGPRFAEPTPRDQLLLRAAVGRGPDAVSAWEEWIAGTELEAVPHPEARLLTQVFTNLHAQGLAATLPARLRGKYRWVWSSNQLRCRAVAPAFDALTAHRIPTMLLKGAALLAGGCTWGSREMGDVDLLVPVARAGEAAAVVESQGWHGIGDVDADYVARRLVFRRHSWNFTGPASGDLDLHWHLTEGLAGDHADDLSWAAARSVTFGAIRTRQPDVTDQLVHTIEHASHAEPAHRLLWLVDIAHLLPRVDPERLVTISKAFNVRDLTAEGLEVASRALESRSAAKLAGRLSETRPGIRERVLALADHTNAGGQRRWPRASALARTAAVQGVAVRHPVAGAKAVVRRWVEPACVRRPIISTGLAALGHPRRLEVACLRVTGPLAQPPASRPLPLGVWCDVAAAGMVDLLGGPGWAWPEPDRSGVWADGVEARLLLDVDTPLGQDLELRFLLGTKAHICPNRSVVVSVNGRPVAAWDLHRAPEVSPRSVVVPAWLATWCRPLEVTFRPSPARDPQVGPQPDRLVEPGDRRRFFQLRSIRVDTATTREGDGRAEAVTAAWEDAALRPDVPLAIHPCGSDPVAYKESGEQAAAGLAHLIGPDPDRTVVDFGAGDGRVTAPLTRRYRRVIAVDASPTMLQRLRARCPDAETVLADGRDPARLPRGVDVVVALAVLIHHRHADAARIIVGLASTLRTGGLLLLDLALYDMGREPQDWTDISVWTRAELETLAWELDLDLVAGPVSPGSFDGSTLGPGHGQILVLRQR